MAENINIIVNETNEIVNVVSSTVKEVVDVNIYPITETVTFNVTEELIKVNVNSVSGGGLVTSVNGQIGDVVVTATQTQSDWNQTDINDPSFINNKPTIPGDQQQSDWNETDINKPPFIKNKPAIPTQTSELINNGDGSSGSSFVTVGGLIPQVNSDWNASAGVSAILNKPTIPTQTSQLTNNGANGTNPFITALDIPTAGQAGTLVREVKNMTGATLTKGTVVYISGANGNKALVSKALATTDELSSRTFGLLQSNILNNGLGNCVIIGDLSGLDTSSFTEGAQLYLSGVTAGTYTSTKILAPTHLVYVGKVTRSHPTQGQIEVGIQNGYELSEIHDVAINGVLDKQLLSYDNATSLWKNKSVTTADITDSTNKRYQTDNQNTYNDATSSIQTQINAKQNNLVNQSNIKSVNGISILGSGDIPIKGVHALIKPYSGLTYSASINQSGIASASAQTANRLVVYPFIPAQTITFTSMYINVFTLAIGALCQIVIYSDLNGLPDQKIYNSADLDCSTTGKKTATTTQTFIAGNTYWIGTHSSSTASLSVIGGAGLITPYIQNVSAGTSYVISPTYGSAPTTFGTPGNSTGVVPFIGITI
jgi:hypothetical protein